jgi:putative intracellular protease/amidase
MNVHSASNRVVIILAHGFAEGETIWCLDRLREAGLPVSLVSLSAGLLNGQHGLAVRPDYSLDQLPLAAGPPRLVIAPGGRQCITSLLADPRVHQLFDATLNNKGFVAGMGTAEPLLNQIVFSTSPHAAHFVPQGALAIDDFVGRLINLLSADARL